MQRPNNRLLRKRKLIGKRRHVFHLFLWSGLFVKNKGGCIRLACHLSSYGEFRTPAAETCRSGRSPPVASSGRAVQPGLLVKNVGVAVGSVGKLTLLRAGHGVVCSFVRGHTQRPTPVSS